MKIHPAPQGTPEWMEARAGVVTASEFDSILTPEFKARTGEMPKTYLAKKLAEKWIGGPLPGFNVWATEQGQILEEEAVPFFTLETGLAVERVGLCLTDDGRVGCSPDGLIGEDCGLEVKCPMIETHMKYLLSGIIPKDYAAQVHGSMYVTGRPRWMFLSYCRALPPLIVTIDRDEEIQEKIAEALADFLQALDVGMKRLVEINGGPPRRNA